MEHDVDPGLQNYIWLRWPGPLHIKYVDSILVLLLKDSFNFTYSSFVHVCVH